MFARLKQLFTEHPASVHETYWQHFQHACWFAGRMQLGAIVAFIHAILPFAFVKTGSNIIRGLFTRMVTNRVVNQPPEGWQPPADWVI